MDPRLESKIKKDTNENITAILSLSDESKANDNSEKIVHEILEDTEKSVNEKANHVEYMPNMKILIVKGKPKFIRKLIEKPEISSATVSDENDFQTT